MFYGQGRIKCNGKPGLRLVGSAAGAGLGGVGDDLPERKMFVSSMKEQLEVFCQIKG